MSSSRDAIRAAYDIVSEAYARKFINELDHKPLDRELLKQFAAAIGVERPVLDIGCGPGHTTAHLTSLGLIATGVDLSPGMIERASVTFPHVPFTVGDFFALTNESSSIAGILALYCIVHLTPDQLVPAFSEMFRVLSGRGVLLLSFHVGSEVVRAENFLDTNAVLDFTFFEPSQIEAALRIVGFDAIDVRIRAPYDTEHPSRRCYVFAHKPESTA
jgi:SAM-dependent methyltransferase